MYLKEDGDGEDAVVLFGEEEEEEKSMSSTSVTPISIKTIR